MVKKKTRKFALGGFADLTGGIGPMSLSMQPRAGGDGGGAYGGLDTVNRGSQQIGQSLQTIGDALGKPSSGGSPGIGGSPIGRVKEEYKTLPFPDNFPLHHANYYKKGGSVKTKKPVKKVKMQSGGTVDDEGRVMDEQTRKNQKGYEAYEREQSDAQRKLEERDKRMIEGARKVKEKVKSVLPFKKGGSVSTASKRADGCAVRGKTRA